MESASTKYAKALVSLAREEGALLEYKKATKAFDELLSTNSQLKKMLCSYFVSNEEKYRIIDEICAGFALKNFQNFIKLLAQKHLIFHFHDIAKEIVLGLNEELHIADGFVYSTTQLSEKQIEQVTKAISKRMGVEVELKNLIDERLIGGIKVVVHDHVFDGSILYKLDSMKQNLKERRA